MSYPHPEALKDIRDLCAETRKAIEGPVHKSPYSPSAAATLLLCAGTCEKLAQKALDEGAAATPPQPLRKGGKIRIVSKEPEGEDMKRLFFPRGQDFQVFFVRPNGEEVNLTKELAITGVTFRVDARQAFATVEVRGAELETTAMLAVDPADPVAKRLEDEFQVVPRDVTHADLEIERLQREVAFKDKIIAGLQAGLQADGSIPIADTKAVTK